MFNSILNSKRSAWYAMVLLLVLLLPYFYLSFFVHPAADDYNYAYLTINKDWVNEYIKQYFIWNGRYLSNVFELINPIAFKSLLFYRFVPVLLILLTIFSVYYLFAAVLNKYLNKITIINLSLSFTLFYLFAMPNIAEGIYWYTGAVVYQLSVISGLIYISLLYRYLFKRIIWGMVFHFLLMALMIVIIIGFNEIVMLLMLFFHFLFLYISFFRNKNNKILATLLFLMVFLFSLIMFFAPGNDARAAYFDNNHQFIKSIVFSLMQTIRFLFNWISNLPFVIFSLLFIVVARQLNDKIELFRVASFKVIVLCALTIPLLVFISVFPAYWSTGILGQQRTMNVACFLFILLWLINLILWTNYYKEHNFFLQLGKIINQKVFAVLFIIALLTMMFTNNGYDAVTDILYGKASRFNKEMNERYDIIARSKVNSIETIEFNPLQNKPATIFVMDITPDTAHWANFGFASYFELKNVSVKND